MPKHATKEQILAAIFGNQAKPESNIVNYNGIEIEVREPTGTQMASIRQKANRNRGKAGAPVEIDEFKALAWTLIECAYVPGTDEHVFDSAFVDRLLALPFSELLRLSGSDQGGIAQLTIAEAAARAGIDKADVLDTTLTDLLERASKANDDAETDAKNA